MHAKSHLSFYVLVEYTVKNWLAALSTAELILVVLRTSGWESDICPALLAQCHGEWSQLLWALCGPFCPNVKYKTDQLEVEKILKWFTFLLFL